MGQSKTPIEVGRAFAECVVNDRWVELSDLFASNTVDPTAPAALEKD